MVKCPNGCQVIPDALTHTCSKHQRAIAEGRRFNCRIKDCKLPSSDNQEKEKV